MKNLKVCLCFVLAISLFTSSCTKDEELSKTELLTIEDGWLFDSISTNFQEIEDDMVNLFLLSLPEAERTPENEANIRAEVGFASSNTNLVEDCNQDNILIFNTDMTMTALAGNIKCEGDPDEETGGTWSFNADETQLTLTDTDGETSVYSIQALNESKLEMKLSESITTFLTLYDLSSIENIEGYDDFINSNFNVTYTFKSN